MLKVFSCPTGTWREANAVTADRHVREQSAVDSPIQQFAQLLPPFFLWIRGQTLKRLEHQVPVFFHAIIQRPDIEKKRTTAWKFENSIQNGPGRRNVAIGKIFLERGPRYRFRDAGMRRQRSQLGSEDKSIARACVEKWLLAKAIPAAKKLAARAIVNRIGPHAIETLRQSWSPFPVTKQDNLSIGMIAMKFVTSLLQFSAQLAVIVNLSVKDDDELSVVRQYRLMAARQIDYGQAPVGQMHRRHR